MIPLHIFIFTVHTEFAQERKALRDQLRGDPLVRWSSGVFLFKDTLASGQHTVGLYMDEVKRHDLQIGLFSSDCTLIGELCSRLQGYRLMDNGRITVGISVFGSATT